MKFHPSLWNAYQLCSQIKTACRYIRERPSRRLVVKLHLFCVASITPSGGAVTFAAVWCRRERDRGKRHDGDETKRHIIYFAAIYRYLHTHTRARVCSLFSREFYINILYYYIKCFEVTGSMFRTRSGLR